MVKKLRLFKKFLKKLHNIFVWIVGCVMALSIAYFVMLLIIKGVKLLGY